MENRDLCLYISRKRPLKTLQLLWFRQMALALSHIHDCSVIVADIACWNILLDSDLSIKFCDFTESTIMPLDTNMETDDDNRYSIYTDIGQLGKVFYEVITRRDCGFNLHENNTSRAILLQRDTLLSTEDIWLGLIIEKCWTPGAYRNASSLVEDLDTVAVDENLNKYHLTLILATVTVAALLSYLVWKRR